MATGKREGDDRVGLVPCKPGLPTSSPGHFFEEVHLTMSSSRGKNYRLCGKWGASSPNQGPGSACLPPMWYGPEEN